ncbi:SNF2-like protein [Alicyclobacillus hesperidum URH17-3-68]|uniref:DEAD/DEAH box helicase n=1 Tax=Alicyclobacillus hesperidum TaxID=89784 RepID=UPI000281C1C1|nr:DEAD/DEAH box helicase [Alicyclobacillus hesperidum]EJY55271.1 SNF2-like protein [Alicyclobacillus hesperidum URH17-3-68]
MQGEGVNAKLGLPAAVEVALAGGTSGESPADRWLIAVRELASHIVGSGDVLAIAVPVENGPAANVRLLRQWALAAADVMVAAGDGTFVAKWAPAWSLEPLLAARFRLLSVAESEPKICNMFSEIDEIDWLFVELVDAIARTRLERVEDSAAAPDRPYRVMYRGESEVMAVWLRALIAKESTFVADGWLVAKTVRGGLAQSGWAAMEWADRSGRPFYEVAFALQAPPPDTPTADWVLEFCVRHRFSGKLVPLSDWWRQTARRWRIEGDVLVAPDAWILPKLREAARHCPQIADALGRPAPSYVEIPVDDVYPLLVQSIPSLVAAGFYVETPKVEQAGDIRVRVLVRQARGGRDKRAVASAGQQWLDAQQLVDFDWSIVVQDRELSQQDFAQMVAEQTPFIRVEGSWRLVPIADILRELERLGLRSDHKATVLDLSRTIALAQESQDLALDVEFATEAAEVKRVVDVFTHALHVPAVEPPYGLRGQLRHYQAHGFSWLMHLREIGCGACLADDMGLGKTVQLLAYLLKLKEEKAAQGVHLLVCPTSLLANWRAELERFTPGLRVYVHHGALRDLDAALAAGKVDVVMTTYATLVRDLDSFLTRLFDVIAIDEAQNIKNAGTKQAQALRMLKGRHKVALTGTPVENRLEELWALMDFLNPGYLGTLAWFRRTFADLASGDKDSASDIARLQALLRPVLLRRRKTDPDIQTELPEKWEVDERAYLTAEQAAMYQAFVDQLFTGIGEGAKAMSRRGMILSTLVRLKQVCDHPCLISGGAPSLRRSGKLRQLMDLLRIVVEDGECALVFTQFRDMGEILCDTMEAEFGVRPQFLHGGLTARSRGEIVESFQNGRDPSPILVLSLRAGGVGLNLTRANHVFHYDRWWNPAVEDQATDRAYRIGQTKDVQVHKMICAGTLEERIDQMILSKRELSEAIVSSSQEWVTELDDDSLRELFALTPQTVFEEDDV